MGWGVFVFYFILSRAINVSCAQVKQGAINSPSIFSCLLMSQCKQTRPDVFFPLSFLSANLILYLSLLFLSLPVFISLSVYFSAAICKQGCNLIHGGCSVPGECT